MGFYGNITNTSNTTFQFDRIYPNRLTMDANANNDGIFIGRYVLVEYQQSAAYPIVYIKDNLFYSSPNCEDITRIKFLSGNRKNDADENNDGYFDGIYENEFVQTQQIGEDKTTIRFYQCIGGNSEQYAEFEEVNPDTSKSNYIINFGIDEMHYSNEKGFKGYDSTVWVKSSVEQNGKLITKYVNIADLNSVVPTFDIAADAPTMTPITPHFDGDSTNVYYKLHMQSPYGFRVKQGVEGQSDDDTVWYKTTYNKEEDETETEIVYEGLADIYYNKAGFDPANANSKVSNNPEDNYIKLEPTGESGTIYAHGGQAKDIQEFSLHLPAIGNMMSDAWDIIHGPNRDDYRGDGENSSLQGRLDAFQDICANQIAVKSSDEDGTIVGSKINNGEKYVHEGDILDKRLNVEDEGLLNNDDPWIRTYINTADLVHSTYQNDSGISQENNNGIAIQHTFHATADSETSLDKNNGEAQISERQKKYIHAIKDLNGNITKTPINAEDGNITDKIKLYTPYVDATGHVVGKNIETITLPYGYKYFKTDGIVSEDKKDDLYSTNVNINGIQETKPIKAESDTEAHNTQDILSINPANKWIQTKLVDTENDGDVLTIAHEIHSIDETVSTQGDNETSHSNLNNIEAIGGNEINLTMYDWTYDNAGHITSKREHTYTLPYGYKKFVVNNSEENDVSAAPIDTTVEPTADNTQDTLNLNASNKWIKFNTSDSNNNDEIQIGHILNKNTVDANKDFGLSSDMTVAQIDANNNQFNIPVIQFDEAGHISKAETHTVSLPNGFTTFASTISNINNADSISGKVGSFSPDTMTDTITLAEGNQWINIETSEDTFTFKHYVKDFNKTTSNYDFNNSKSSIDQNSFITTNWTKDRAGHLIAGVDTTYTLPNGIKTLSIQDTGKDTVNIVTGSAGPLTADNLVDTMTIDNGNRWIRLVANGKIVKLYHDAPNSASNSANTTNANDNNNKTLSFDSTFEVPQVKYDETGHIFGINKHTITLPSTSTLQLNNYSKGTSTAAITTNETINNAFGKLENRLDILQGDKDVIGSIDNKISIEVAKILDDADPNDIDTLNEIATWIVNDSTGAAKMANDIATLNGNDTKVGSVAKSIKDAIDNLNSNASVSDISKNYLTGITIENGIITGKTERALGSAAFTESSAYVDVTTYTNKIKELEDKIKELENKLNPEPEIPSEGE